MENPVPPFPFKNVDGLSRFLISIVFLAFTALTIAPAHAQSKYAAIVIDADTKEILDQRYANEPRYPASITKVMTLYLLFDAIERGQVRMDEYLPVSRYAASQPPSKLGVNAGSRIRVDDAIKSQVLRSANDVSVVIAERLGGDVNTFAGMMTRKARELGMNNTTFKNPNGLPNAQQVTTAADLARLAIAVRRDFPQHFHWFSVRQMTWNGRTIGNHNRLLGAVDGVDGLKTGFTTASGYNLATTAQRDGRRLVGVVMGGSSGAARDAHMSDLIEAGFSELRRRSVMAGRSPVQTAGLLGRASVDMADAQALGADDVPTRLALRGVVEQGDAEDRGAVQVQMTDATEFEPKPGPKLMEVTRRAPNTDRPTETRDRNTNRTPPRASTTADAADKNKKPSELAGGRNAAKPKDTPFKKGNWAVQVGAFQKEEQANQQLAMIARRIPPALSGAKKEVVSVDRNGETWYRARFTGLAASSATEACKTLAARGMNCMSIAGGGR